MALLAAVLALTGGLAAACFVKAFGITFLARPRSVEAQEAKEVSLTMKTSMLCLSFLTIIFGIAAPVIIKLLTPIAGSVLKVDTSKIIFRLNNFVLKAGFGREIYLSPIFISIMLIFIIAAVMTAVYFWRGENKKRRNMGLRLLRA